MAELSATVLYSVIFGSDRFEFYLGELQFIHSSLFERSVRSEKKKLNKHPKVAKFMQNQREVQIALNISSLIQKYVDYMLYLHATGPKGDNSTAEVGQAKDDIAADMFVEFVSKDVKDMCKTPLGRSLVRCIGEGILETLYKEQAGRGSPKRSSSSSSSLSANHSLSQKIKMSYHQAARTVGYKVRLAKSGVNSIVALLKMSKIKSKARARQKTADAAAVAAAFARERHGVSMPVDALAQFDQTVADKQFANSFETNNHDDDEDEDEDEEDKKLATLLTKEEKAQIEVYMDSIRENM